MAPFLSLSRRPDIDEKALAIDCASTIGFQCFFMSLGHFGVYIFGASVVVQKAVEFGGYEPTDQLLFAETGEGFKDRGKITVDLFVVERSGNQTLHHCIKLFFTNDPSAGDFEIFETNAALGFKQFNPPDLPGVCQHD